MDLNHIFFPRTGFYLFLNWVPEEFKFKLKCGQTSNQGMKGEEGFIFGFQIGLTEDNAPAQNSNHILTFILAKRQTLATYVQNISRVRNQQPSVLVRHLLLDEKVIDQN